MTTDRSSEYLARLVRELCKLPHETEWVEFKVNNTDPQEIGRYLSALANAAALNGKAFAYLVWGVEDQTHGIVGTNFAPGATRKGNEPLDTWLLRLLTPKIHFRFNDVTVDGMAVVLLEIGSTNVGSIVQTYRPGTSVAKGDEKGYFCFGGSSTLLLFEPGRVRLSADLVEQSRNQRELYARVGDPLGTAA